MKTKNIFSEHICNDVNETHRLAKCLVDNIKSGLILLYGDVGNGKTAFCNGIFDALSCEGYCSSPTFAIANVYKGDNIFAHFDVYRISGEEDLELSGFYDYLDDGALVAVEWAELAPYLKELPHVTVDIQKSITDPENTRIITITDERK